MTISNTNYCETLYKLEQLKYSLKDIQESIINQVPQGLTNEFDKSSSTLMNWVDELEITLNEFNNLINQ